MKHLYRNILCIVLILVAAGGIVLMSLNILGILNDGLGGISRAISDGTETGLSNLYDNEIKDMTAITVKSDYNGTFYLRSEGCGDYDADARTFDAADSYREKVSYSPLAYYANKIKCSGAKDYYLEVTPEKGQQYLFRPDYSEIGIDDSSCTDIRVKDNGKKHTIIGRFYPEYVESKIESTPFSNETITEEEEKYAEFVHKKYTNLTKNYNAKNPSKVKAEEKKRNEVLSYAREKGLNPESSTYVYDVTKFLTSKFAYGLINKKCPKNEDLVMFFLQNSDRGICNNFASASVYLYRAAGIPCRFVTGYLVNNAKLDESGDYIYEVPYRNCHAWVEVYVDGSGWKRIDNTSGRPDAGIDNLPDMNYGNEDEPDKPDNPDDPKPEPDTSLKLSDFKISARISNQTGIYDGKKKEVNLDDYLSIGEITGYESYDDGYEESPDQPMLTTLQEALDFISSHAPLDKTWNLTYTYKFRYQKNKNRVLIGEFGFVCEIHIYDGDKDVTDQMNVTFEYDDEGNKKSFSGFSSLAKASAMCQYTIEKRKIHLWTDGKILYDGSFVSGDGYDEFELPGINGMDAVADTDKCVLVSRDRTSIKKSEFDEKDEIKDTFEVEIMHQADENFDTETDVTFCYDIEYDYGVYKYNSQSEEVMKLPSFSGGVYEIR